MATDDGTTPAQLAGELEAARQELARLAAADDEHRRTEAELRASRERYRRLAEDSPAVVYQFRLAPDGAMSMPFVSSDVAQLSGRSAADVMEDAATLIDMVHPDDRAAFVERIQASARALAPYRHVFRAVREGEILWIEAQSTPIREPGGGVLWHGFFTDVSERVGMEEQLRRANRALATAGAFRRVVNRAETEAELAREVCRILVEVGGYRLAWVGLAEHDDAKTVRPVGHAGCEDGYVDSLEIRWADEERGRGPTGTAIRTAEPVIARFIRTDSAFEPWRAEALRRGYGSSCALPVAHGGEAIGALNVYACEDDAFDEREVALLSELAEDLAQGVQVLKARAEREQAELHRRALEAQLQQAQKLESLGVLASGLAHDFNNLLVGIYGNMDLALHHLDAESPVRECVDRAKTASRRAADLISQMLAYAGQGTTTTEELDLNRLVAEMANLLRASIDKKTTLRLDMPSDLPLTRGDPTQLRQVVMNLITNAAQAVGQRRGEIVLRAERLGCERAFLDEVRPDETLPAGPYLRLEVSDTGPGMDEATLARIFDPFFTTKETGSGLGLSAVHGIVRSHQGAITVDSTPGEGTSFAVLLPAVPAAARSAAPRPAPTRWRGTGTILVADDEPMVRTVAKAALERLGFTVLTAVDGAQAIELFRERQAEVDCVLLDWKMPHMDGDETLAELLRIRSDVPVVLCSGLAEESATRKSASLGLAGFLQKPYGVTELAGAVRRALEGA